MSSVKDANDATEPFIMVPKWLLKLDGVLPIAKLLYGLILGLARNKDYCYASNAYLARALSSKPSYVTELIKHLECISKQRSNN